jgi:hypothetical protein
MIPLSRKKNYRIYWEKRQDRTEFYLCPGRRIGELIRRRHKIVSNDVSVQGEELENLLGEETRLC